MFFFNANQMFFNELIFTDNLVSCLTLVFWFSINLLTTFLYFYILVFLSFLLIHIGLVCVLVAYIIYCKRHALCNQIKMDKEFWSRPLRKIGQGFLLYGRIMHGYEIIGLENIPKNGPALLVIYHAAIGIDIAYVKSKIFLEQNRLPRAVADRYLFTVKGIRNIFEMINATSGSIEECESILNSGDLLLISPGGVREALFSDTTYNIVWNNRLGFAKIAMNTKVVLNKISILF
jgi:1-acyl-sn-glycerol-3-phosphate acyltransferase